MPIEICTVGGYNEIGKNCTAIKVDDEVVLCDLGIYLEKYIKLTEDEDIISISPNKLMKEGALADVSKIKDWKDKVLAIIPTHAHLDHVGAIPFIASKFDAPILCTPYTSAVIKAILKDEKMSISNDIKTLTTNSIYKLSKKITIEFINMTHSTPQTVMVAIHTPYGVILYANDFKFDSTPTLGKKPNFKRLKELGKKRILALIVDSTYAPLRAKTPSEAVAKELLKEVMLGTESKDKAVIVTTFSSHLARLKSIIEFGKQMKNRKIVFMGRSLAKYVKAGEDIGIIDFSKKANIIKFSKQVRAKLKEVNKNRGKYLLVVTGHQAEPKATLSRLVRNELPFEFKPEDQVIFSSSVIPTEMNIRNREKMEKALQNKGVRIFRNVHVSGHAAREDIRDLINMLNPRHIIPAHGELQMRQALKDLALEMGYNKKYVHLSSDGNRIKL
ncbi:RNase J family beta-CASP ribonuclease [Candidatus Woesearchaeota archaeon]|nr:RNase J family beta-CASP ribonuclease [Candidatus Woesearchaeota archaeon]